MSRILIVILMLLATSAVAQTAQRPLAQAMKQVRAGNYEAAQMIAKGDGKAAVDLVIWHQLRDGRGGAAMATDFLKRNDDWPGLPYLRENSEAAMASADPETIRNFYADYTPRTVAGVLSLTGALITLGDTDAAEKALATAWRTLPMTSDEQNLLVAAHGEMLRPYHEDRLDTALWMGWEDTAKSLMPLVSDGWRRLAQARLDLRAVEKGVDGRIRQVPDALRSHPGLAYERFLWRISKKRPDDALALMLEVSTSAETLGRPEIWSKHRMPIARELLQQGKFTQAYRVAANHHLTEGSSFAALEWFAGFVALRKLDRAKDAKDHFERFISAVETPISLGRGGYWLGRAYEAMGDDNAARQAYEFGARYQTSFYGLLSAERGRIGFDESLRGLEQFAPWREASFLRSGVFEAAVLLLAAGELDLSERFFTHLAESLTRRQIGQLSTLLDELKQPHILTMLGKRAADYGHQIPAPYYPLHPLAERRLRVPPELALAITRRESEFDPSVVSPAGAMGLMQVMPGTAKEVSAVLNQSFSPKRLVDEPEFNVTIGTEYLAQLAETFGGNAVLMAAAYNAGPSRPEAWMQAMGDPRAPDVDVIDWIEQIPFAETRNYVMRVTESLPIYRARLGEQPFPVPFSKELSGATLLARSP